MRNLFRFSAAAALTLLWLGNAVAREPAGTKPATCGEYGTSLHFEDSPSAAAQRALKEEKLVMVLHISGHFEDPEFT